MAALAELIGAVVRAAALLPWMRRCAHGSRCLRISIDLPLGSVMAAWSILLLPPEGARRARPRWLCASGCFSLQPQRAWTITDPDSARLRIAAWIQAKGHPVDLMARMVLVDRPRCIAAAASTQAILRRTTAA